MNEFPNKNWSLTALTRLLKNIDNSGNYKRKRGSGRQRTTRTKANIEKVEEMVLSQETEPGTHQSPREISKHTGLNALYSLNHTGDHTGDDDQYTIFCSCKQHHAGLSRRSSQNNETKLQFLKVKFCHTFFVGEQK